MARLTETQRHEIAKRWAGGGETAAALAAEFGLSVTYISVIARRRGNSKQRKRSNAKRKVVRWSQKLERLRASGKLTEFVFKVVT